jgi:hypothetical protein
MLLASIMGCTSPAVQTQNNMHTLMNINRGIDSVYVLLQQSYDTYQATEMDNALEGLNNYLAATAQKIGSMQVDDNCKPLLEALAYKVETMRDITATESKEQVRIYKIPDTDFGDDLRKKWDDIASHVEKKITNANAKVTDECNKIKNKQQ